MHEVRKHSSLDEGCVSTLSGVYMPTLIVECMQRAQNHGVTPEIISSFVFSLLENSVDQKIDGDGEILTFLFLNSQTRIGTCTYMFLSSEFVAPSIHTIKHAPGIDARDLLLSSSAGVQKLEAYFDTHPFVPGRVIVQHDGIHIRQGATWSKFNTFVSFVDQECAISHFLLGELHSKIVVHAHTTKVFLLSVVHTGVTNIVRVVPCAASMTSLDYLNILDELLESLDCYNIQPVPLCFDAASAVVKRLSYLEPCVEHDEQTFDNAEEQKNTGVNGQQCESETADVVKIFSIHQQ